MFEKPSPLRPGDAVGIFLPASPVKEPFRSQGLQALQRLGFRPVEIGNVFEKNDFLARRPENAFEDLLRFLRDPEIKALWAGRGGYGSNHLYPFLSRLQGLAAKPLIASSDVSYLLWFMLERLHLVVFYGPMVYGALAEGSFDDQQTLAVLCQPQPPPPIPGRGFASGTGAGHCHRRLPGQFRFAARHAPSTAGANRILLLEDVNERPFRLDRMMWQMRASGRAAGACGRWFWANSRVVSTMKTKKAIFWRGCRPTPSL